MSKLPISAMVVGLNESNTLEKCLRSIDFCDDILYADLGSTDNSIELVSSFTNRIFLKELKPSGEYIQSELVHHTKNDWVIFIDPDEVVDKDLRKEILQNFQQYSNNPNLGGVLVPWHFYFKKHKLKGTIWGGDNKKYLLVNKNRFDFLPITHYGRKLKNGFSDQTIPLNESGTNILHHYWMSSFKLFFLKHFRYLKKEGRDQYNLGVRVSVKSLLKIPFISFSESFFVKKGYRDGLLGLFLSCFWAYYKTYIFADIRRIQKSHKISNSY